VFFGFFVGLGVALCVVILNFALVPPFSVVPFVRDLLFPGMVRAAWFLFWFVFLFFFFFVSCF